ncbi:MAG: hypothetical protein OCD02_10970 [Spirochaetaceae bacterium]
MENITNTLIQYEENIFYLKLSLNNIKKAQLLNINRELFQNKIKQDLAFIQKCTNVLYEHLQKNSKFITMNEQLHSIQSLKKLFNREVNSLIKSGFIKKSDFIEQLEINNFDIEKISDKISEIADDVNKEDLTTNEELNILLMDDMNNE